MDLTNEIPDAIENKNNIIARELQGYCCGVDIFGDPLSYSGNFGIVYPLTAYGRNKKCLRLWYKGDGRPKNVSHVKAVSGYFARTSIPYIINYSYVETALRLSDGSTIPGVIMDWVEGSTMMEYVKANYRNTYAISGLANKFYHMCNYMNYNRLSHGDLSGDNIVVGAGGNLTLVDYDSFYVPTLILGIKQPTLGIPCYQHPKRVSGLYISAKDDYFSQKVIYLSLLVLAKNPSLFNEDTDKALLIPEEALSSLYAFKTSPVYRSIANIKDNKIQHYLNELETALSLPISMQTPLSEFTNRVDNDGLAQILALLNNPKTTSNTTKYSRPIVSTYNSTKKSPFVNYNRNTKVNNSKSKKEDDTDDLDMIEFCLGLLAIAGFLIWGIVWAYNTVVDFFRKDDIEIVESNGKYGIYNHSIDKKTTECMYDSITSSKDSTQNFFMLYSNGKIGVADSEGRKSIDCILDSIHWIGSDVFKIYSGAKQGLITKDGKKLFDAQYYAIVNTLPYSSQGLTSRIDHYIGNIIPIKVDKKSGWRLYTREGKVVNYIEYKYVEQSGLPDVVKVRLTYSSRYGLVDKNGVSLLPKDYYEITKFRENRAWIRKTYRNNRMTCIDENGKKIFSLANVKSVGHYSEGLCAVINEQNLIGYYDINGTLKIPFKYHRALIKGDSNSWWSEEFFKGKAHVSDGTTEGYIDKEGNFTPI